MPIAPPFASCSATRRLLRGPRADLPRLLVFALAGALAGALAIGSAENVRGEEIAEPSPEQRVAGDVDRDGDVDFEDRSRLVQLFGLRRGEPGWQAGADLDRSGRIDFGDYRVWVGIHEGLRPVAAEPPPAEPHCGWLGPETAVLSLLAAPARCRRAARGRSEPRCARERCPRSREGGSPCPADVA